MTLIQPGKKRNLLPTYKGVVIVDTWRGKLRIRAWPKMPRRKKQVQLDQMERFRQAQWAAKMSSARQQVAAAEATAGTALLPRDVQVMAMYGRAFTWLDSDTGQRVYSMASRQDVSLSLDALGDLPGDVLVRGAESWLVVSPGAPGLVLTSNQPGLAPSWQAPSGGGAQTEAWGWPVGQTPNSSTHAGKGWQLVLLRNATLSEIAWRADTTAGGTYQPFIVTMTGVATIQAIIWSGTPVAEPSFGTFTRSQAVNPALALTAGTRYALMLYRTDATPTTSAGLRQSTAPPPSWPTDLSLTRVLDNIGTTPVAGRILQVGVNAVHTFGGALTF